MNIFVGKRPLLVFSLLCMFFLSALDCHGAEKADSESPSTRIDAGKEVLVARDIGGGLPYSLIKWCGNNALLVYGDEFGTELFDLEGNRITVSKNSKDYPVGCTPDGKWVIFKDWSSAREYRDKHGRLPDNIVDDGPGWHGFVIDLYRYEIATGRRQKFAVVRDDSSGLVSPDGSKVLLGNRHDSVIEMPEPEWEAVWLTNDWVYGETRWFEDSSGIVTMIWDNGYSLGVEFFGKERWAREFNLDMLRSDPTSLVSLAAVDKDKVLYFVAMADYAAGDSPWKVYNFFHCKARYKNLVCSLGNGIKGDKGENIRSLELLPNGDVILEREEDNCIRRVKHRQLVLECIADTRYNDKVYISIDLMEISPNGKWMAFSRSKLPPPGDRFYAHQYDLFVKELYVD